MPTTNELQKELKTLREQVIQIRSSNSDLRDEVVQLQDSYSKLIDHVNTRFQAVNNRFL